MPRRRKIFSPFSKRQPWRAAWCYACGKLLIGRLADGATLIRRPRPSSKTSRSRLACPDPGGRCPWWPGVETRLLLAQSNGLEVNLAKQAAGPDAKLKSGDRYQPVGI